MAVRPHHHIPSPHAETTSGFIPYKRKEVKAQHRIPRSKHSPTCGRGQCQWGLWAGGTQQNCAFESFLSRATFSHFIGWVPESLSGALGTSYANPESSYWRWPQEPSIHFVGGEMRKEVLCTTDDHFVPLFKNRIKQQQQQNNFKTKSTDFKFSAQLLSSVLCLKFKTSWRCELPPDPTSPPSKQSRIEGISQDPAYPGSWGTQAKVHTFPETGMTNKASRSLSKFTRHLASFYDMLFDKRWNHIYLNSFGVTKVAISKGGPVYDRLYPYSVSPHVNSYFSHVASTLALWCKNYFK